MREILFRGKRPDNGEWVCGNYIISPTFPDIHMIEDREPTISASGMRCFKGCPRVDPATVGQYTGVKDKNGRRIFEGDVVICSLIGGDIYHPPYSWNRKVVVYERGAFCVEDLTGDTVPLHDYVTVVETEIIGNIHDNPELLKGGRAK